MRTGGHNIPLKNINDFMEAFMRAIVEYHLTAYETRRSKSAGKTVEAGKTVALGTISSTLYGGLYTYSAELVELAEMTRDGEKALFVVPIAVAFLFTLVHGTFTGYFWDLLGLKAKH
jgi:hypothetical protein